MCSSSFSIKIRFAAESQNCSFSANADSKGNKLAFSDSPLAWRDLGEGDRVGKGGPFELKTVTLKSAQ